MRHNKAGRKFGRNTSHRKAMFRNLAANLFLHEKIETTDEKAKELRRVVERIISKATRLGDDLTADVGKLSEEKRTKVVAARMHAQRLVAAYLPKKVTKTVAEEKEGVKEISEVDVDLIHKVFHDIAPRYMARVKENKGGGYTRIIKLGNRRGDNAAMSVIELVSA